MDGMEINEVLSSIQEIIKVDYDFDDFNLKFTFENGYVYADIESSEDYISVGGFDMMIIEILESNPNDYEGLDINAFNKVKEDILDEKNEMEKPCGTLLTSFGFRKAN